MHRDDCEVCNPPEDREPPADDRCTCGTCDDCRPDPDN